MAAARAAAARRARQAGRRAAAGRAHRRSRRSTRSAPTARRSTRCGRCTASAPSPAPTSEAGRAAVAGADASGRGRPQGRGDGAAGVARGRAPATTAAILDARSCADPDLHTRLAAILRLAELPASDAAGKALYAASPRAGQLRRPLVEPRPLHRRQPPQGAVPDAVPRRPGEAGHRRAADRACASGAPGPTGGSRPRPCSPSDWKAMEVPGSWESRGLTAFDGVVWFTRDVDWPADRRGAGDGPLRAHRQHRRGVGQRHQRRRRRGRSRPRAAARRSSRCPDGVLQGRRRTPSPSASRTCAATAASSARRRRWSSRAASTSSRWPAAGVTASSGRPTRRALYSRPGELAAHVASAGTPPPADAVLAAAPATAKAGRRAAPRRPARIS